MHTKFVMELAPRWLSRASKWGRDCARGRRPLAMERLRSSHSSDGRAKAAKRGVTRGIAALSQPSTDELRPTRAAARVAEPRPKRCLGRSVHRRRRLRHL